MKPTLFTPALCSAGVALLALSLTACQPRVEQEEAFKEQVSRIDTLTDDVKAIRHQTGIMDRDLQQVTMDLSEIKKNGGVAGGGDTSALEQRLLQLEAALRQQNEVISNLNQEIASLEGELQQVASRPAATRTASASEPARSSSGAGQSGASQAPAEQAPPVQTPEPSPPSGTYHQVEQGDSLASLASEYGTTEAKIRQANRLPAGREIIPGQRLFIPGV